jgi:hypothetical protein
VAWEGGFNGSFKRKGMHWPQIYQPAIKFRNIEQSALQAVQLESEDRDLSDTDSDSDNEGDETYLDAPLPLWVIGFEIDTDIDITSHALQDMIATDPSVVPSAALQSSIPTTTAHNTQEKVMAKPDWDW